MKVTVPPLLKARAQVEEVCALFWDILCVTQHSFNRLFYNPFKLHCTTHVRRGLEHGGVCAFSCIIEEFTRLESIQSAPNRLAVKLRVLSHRNRFQLTALFPNAYRRAQIDVICIRRMGAG